MLVAANFRPVQLWVSPEPGAGLIRDQPELIAVTELYAYPGRGGALVYELDDAGNRIPDPDADKNKDEATEARRKKKQGHLSESAARKKAAEARKKEEEKKKREIEAQRKIARLAGGAEAKKEEAETTSPGAEVPMKEKTQGIRWVAITGVLNYKVLHTSYLLALKRPEVAYPHFKQLDVERQIKQSDGSWSDWEAIDQSRNLQILDHLPEEDEEWTPESVRISTLVAPLPFLKAGFWERVHVRPHGSRREVQGRRAAARGRWCRRREGRRCSPRRAAPARAKGGHDAGRRAADDDGVRRHGRID